MNFFLSQAKFHLGKPKFSEFSLILNFLSLFQDFHTTFLSYALNYLNIQKTITSKIVELVFVAIMAYLTNSLELLYNLVQVRLPKGEPIIKWTEVKVSASFGSSNREQRG